MAKAPISISPRSRPESTIELLANRFSEYLHFPDPSPLYALMGAVAGNMIPGNPVWLMLVGPPSCGKTELLNSLSGMDGVHTVSSIKGPAALLSGVPKKERSKDATGGILRKIGTRGCIVMKDFTSMLSLPHDPLVETLGNFREIYDGRWSRDIGGEGGTSLHWSGKLAMFAGVTGAIDRHHMVTSEMGERWIYFRYPNSDGWGESRKALEMEITELDRASLRESVKAIFEGEGLKWGGDNQSKRSLDKPEEIRLISMASFAARARSAVARNSYTRDIEDIPTPESPTRLATILGQVYHGLDILGLSKIQSWALIGKIAMDCMPQTRRRVLDMIMENGQADATDLKTSMHTSASTVRRTIEDLEVHGVVEKQPGKTIWRLSNWSENEIKQGWR